MLQGSFETFQFPEVLNMLSRKRQTGRLRLHSSSSVVDIHLADGRLSHAEVSRHGAAVQVADTRPRLEEACFEVLRWDHGSFEFHPGKPSGPGQRLDAPVEGVLNGARARLEQWRQVERIVPSMDVQPRLVRDVGRDDITLDRAAWRVVSAVDGRRNVQTLARTLSLSQYELGSILSRLVADGLVEINSSRPKVALAPKVPARESTMSSVRLPDRDDSGEAGGEAGEGGAAKPDGAAGTHGAAGTDGGAGKKEPALLRIVSRYRVAPSGS